MIVGYLTWKRNTHITFSIGFQMSYFHFSKQKHVFLLIILSRDLDDGQMLKISDFPLLSAHN